MWNAPGSKLLRWRQRKGTAGHSGRDLRAIRDRQERSSVPVVNAEAAFTSIGTSPVGAPSISQGMRSKAAAPGRMGEGAAAAWCHACSRSVGLRHRHHSKSKNGWLSDLRFCSPFPTLPVGYHSRVCCAVHEMVSFLLPGGFTQRLPGFYLVGIYRRQ